MNVASQEIDSDAAEVLVVDRDAELQMLISIFLKRMGFSAVCATGGTEALELAETNDWDYRAVIIDFPISVAESMLFFQKIKSRMYSTPVLLISGYSPSRAAAESARNRHMAYLAKPFGFPAFSRTFRNLLQQCPLDPVFFHTTQTPWRSVRESLLSGTSGSRTSEISWSRP